MNVAGCGTNEYEVEGKLAGGAGCTLQLYVLVRPREASPEIDELLIAGVRLTGAMMDCIG